MPLLHVTPTELRELTKLADIGAGSRLLLRYRIILMAAQLDSASEISRQLNTSRNNVRLWIGRFEQRRIDGLTTLPGRGPKLANAQLSNAIRLEFGNGKTLPIPQRELAKRLNTSVASLNRELRRQDIHSTTYRGAWRDHAAGKSFLGIYLDPPFSIFAIQIPTSELPSGDLRDGEAASLDFDRALSALRDGLARLPKSAGQHSSLDRFLRQLRRIATDSQIGLWANGRIGVLEQIASGKNCFRVRPVLGPSPWPHNILSAIKPLIKHGEEFETWARQFRLTVAHRRRFGSLSRPWFRTLVRPPLGSMPC